MKGKYNNRIQDRYRKLVELDVLKNNLKPKKTSYIYGSVFLGIAFVSLFVYNSERFFDYIKLDKRYKNYIQSQNKYSKMTDNRNQINQDKSIFVLSEKSLSDSDSFGQENINYNIEESVQHEMNYEDKIDHSRDARKSSVSVKFEPCLNS